MGILESLSHEISSSCSKPWVYTGYGFTEHLPLHCFTSHATGRVERSRQRQDVPIQFALCGQESCCHLLFFCGKRGRSCSVSLQILQGSTSLVLTHCHDPFTVNKAARAPGPLTGEGKPGSSREYFPRAVYTGEGPSARTWDGVLDPGSLQDRVNLHTHN